MSVEPSELTRVLSDVFGHDELREGQQEIIDSVLGPRHTLAVMPTGSGKSLCYQLPAILLPGTAVVVSPLIALIRDQVVALRQRGVRAASYTSADDSAERRQAMQDLAAGELDLIYVAPERFRSASFMRAMQDTEISLFVVDEAHCISEWGHDFRPDYARLGEVIRALDPPRVVGLTATATPDVQDDIVKHLGVGDVETIVTGFDRPNLELSVEEVGGGKSARLAAVTGAIDHWMGDGGSAIVYVATRKTSEQVAEALTGKGYSAAAYHAGLPSDRRKAVQDAFERSKLSIVVATTAFGMGIDKSDVRVVVHYHVPSSIEAYYQEVGRGGRDGEAAGGVLIYDRGDLRYAFLRLEGSCPSFDVVKRAHARARGLVAEDPGLGFDDLCDALSPDLGASTRAALIALERAGDLRFEPGGPVVSEGAPNIAASVLEARERKERARLDAIIGYVSRSACRRRYVVDYFGDRRRPDACGVCDRCREPPARELEGAALNEALMALSCVARMKGRFGRTRVADVLAGSRAKPVLDARLESLSTHGLLTHRSKDEICILLDGLVQAGLSQVTVGEYPKLGLTELGAETLRSRGPIAIVTRAPRPTKAKKRKVSDDEPVVNQALYTALKEWRRSVARELGRPAYTVAHDRMLRAVANLQPKSLEELGSLSGIGPARLEAHGSAILSIVAECRR